MKILQDALSELIEIAKILKLEESDINNAKDFLTHNEFGLCYDTIITQMYEYDIEIDNDCYKLISKIGEKMNLKTENYAFMKELIREENKIPKPVKEKWAKIVTSLMT